MNSVGEAICGAIGLREATASVARSHWGNCACTTCRAAQGDNEAMTALVANLMLKKQEDLDA